MQINDSPQCLSGLCHHRTRRWHHPVRLSTSASPLATVSFAPLHGFYSSPGGTSSDIVSDPWNPPNFKRRHRENASTCQDPWTLKLLNKCYFNGAANRKSSPSPAISWAVNLSIPSVSDHLKKYSQCPALLEKCLENPFARHDDIKGYFLPF